MIKSSHIDKLFILCLPVSSKAEGDGKKFDIMRRKNEKV